MGVKGSPDVVVAMGVAAREIAVRVPASRAPALSMETPEGRTGGHARGRCEAAVTCWQSRCDDDLPAGVLPRSRD